MEAAGGGGGGSVTREEGTCGKVVMSCGSGESWSPVRKWRTVVSVIGLIRLWGRARREQNFIEAARMILSEFL